MLGNISNSPGELQASKEGRFAVTNSASIQSFYQRILGNVALTITTNLQDPKLAAPVKNIIAQLKLKNREVFAVECGVPPSFQCCVIVPVNRLPEVLRLNPMLECMPRTEWNQLHHIWIRIEGWRPSNAFCENSMWVSSGLVPVLDMPPGSQEFTRTAEPASCKQQTIIPFESINWLKTSRNLFLRQRVECKHGPLLLLKENNRHELNYRTAAEFIVASSQLAYHSVQDTFTANPHKQPEPDQLSVERVRQSIMDFLHNVSVNHPTQFPANRVSRRTTNILLELLKSVCGTEPITEKTSLRDYVRTSLVRQAGATVTTEELYLDYLRYCNQLKFPPPLVPRRHFLTLMPKIMQEELGVLKSHCVPRSGASGNAATARNGFFGTAYRKEQDSQDHNDGQDV